VSQATARADAPSTRERILAAALAAFAERGVEATSLDAVAAAVGVRKQTLLYWFPSKENLLLGVVDHAIDELGRELGTAAAGAGADRGRRIEAVVDATFRVGRRRPELLAVVREVTRLGPPASTRLADAVQLLLPDDIGPSALAYGAQVVGIATEAEVRADLGLPADLAWLRARRRALLADLVAALDEPDARG
jgi:AcrR family transcriptional regulator